MGKQKQQEGPETLTNNKLWTVTDFESVLKRTDSFLSKTLELHLRGTLKALVYGRAGRRNKWRWEHGTFFLIEIVVLLDLDVDFDEDL